MLVLGANVDSDFVVNKSFASSEQSPKLVRLDKLQLAGENLGEFSPYLPDRGDLVARGDDVYYTQDDRKIIFNYTDQEIYFYYSYNKDKNRYEDIMVVSKLETFEK